MKRLTILVLLLFSLQILNVGAYDISVDSASEQQIVLAVSDLNTVDLQLQNIVATVETQTVSDTYTIDATAKVEDQRVLIIIDVTPIFQDYSLEEVKAITVSGLLTIQGEDIEFGKRIPYRSGSSSQGSNLELAPALTDESPNIIYSIIGLSLVLVFLILILFYKKPTPSVSTKKEKKKPVKKRKVVKKKATKKAKKRL